MVDHSGNDDGDDGDTEHRTPASSILILYKSLDGCSSNRYNDPHFQEEETEAQRSELAFSSPHSQQQGSWSKPWRLVPLLNVRPGCRPASGIEAEYRCADGCQRKC